MTVSELLKMYGRRMMRRCSHEEIRCIHGDEIIARAYMRSMCLDCGKLFPELTTVCFYTKKPHTDYEMTHRSMDGS